MSRNKRGLGSTTLRLLELCQDIVRTRAPITVRGVAYQLFVLGKIPSMAVGQTQKTSRLLVYAREHNIVDWDDIVDETRSAERVPQWNDLSSFARVLSKSYRKDFWATQPYNVQVWSEKATVGGILRPITEKYGVPFLAVHGFSSATVMHDIAVASAADSRHLVVLYVGDHDPSGRYMSDEDLPNRMDRYGGRAAIRRIALTKADLAGLPSFKATSKDPRLQWYRAGYGEDCWELDALDPNILRDRVEGHIRRYIDHDAWARMKIVEAAEQKSVRQVALAWQGEQIATG